MYVLGLLAPPRLGLELGLELVPALPPLLGVKFGVRPPTDGRLFADRAGSDAISFQRIRFYKLFRAVTKGDKQDEFRKMQGFISIMNMFRKLWFEHVVWTRSFIISTAANLGDLQPVTARLLRNPTDFANALISFYGADKANRFSDLLTEHLTIAAQLVNAAKAGNTEALNNNRTMWYANADKIAGFLAILNPYWSKSKWVLMLDDHLKLTEDEAVARLTGQYAKDVSLFDAIEDQALIMGDEMPEGIIRQFRIT